jgi:putative aldouronate transport system permease protein
VVAAVTEKRPDRTEGPERRVRTSRPTKVRVSGVDRVFLIGVYALLITFLLVVLLPLL